MTQQQSERDVVWLTQAKYDELQGELADLKTTKRAEIVQRVSEAREEGDLKENGGYHAAREELGKIDGRIAQLVDMLEKAQVGEAVDDGTISPGTKVSYRFDGDDGVEVFLLAAREMAGDEDIDVFSPKSPLGSAILGHKVGDVVEYEAPNGKQLKVEILDAKPYEG